MTYRSILTLFLCISSSLFGGMQLPKRDFLRTGCNEIYTSNVARIFEQFGNRLTEQQRRSYEKFMIRLKQFSDLEFQITAFERAITDDIRIRLRTPITKYSACRTKLAANAGVNFQTPGPTATLLGPCEGSFAVRVQSVLNSLRGLVPDATLAQYKDYMVTLKHFEDIKNEIEEFRKVTDNVTLSRLRMPLVEYNTCRDSLRRIDASGALFPMSPAPYVKDPIPRDTKPFIASPFEPVETAAPAA